MPLRAALPMYDLPELRPATDAWWAAIRQELVARGVEAPAGLDRPEDASTFWRRPDLLLSQCCGHDLMHGLNETVAVVAVPDYVAPGCGAGRYRSAIVARKGAAGDLASLARGRLAVNGPSSHSGHTALRHALKAAGAAWTPGRSVVTGSHRASVQAVATGAADLAAIDAVTLALLGDAAPDELEGIATVFMGASAPALPYVASRSLPEATRRAVADALFAAAADPALTPVRHRLRLRGFVPPAAVDYRRIVAMGAEAA